MQPSFLEIIHSSNPWLSDSSLFPQRAEHHFAEPFIPRIAPQVSVWPVRKKAHLVVGARQVGKSSLLWHWFLERKTAPLFINAEEPLIRSWSGSPILALKDIEDLVTHRDMPILIDEAQHLPEAGLFIKGLMDGGLKNPLFVTGSSAFHLQDKTRESLAGRAERLVLHPLSLREISRGLNDLAPAVAALEMRKKAERQAVFGSYPEAWLSSEPEKVLRRLVDAYVLRDASDFFKIQNLDAFRRLLHLAAGQIGSLVNLSEWAGICGVSRTAIANYLSMLEDSHLIATVRPYLGRKRAEITNRSKIYFCDNGILAAAGAGFNPLETRSDRGPLFENWVAGELLKLVSSISPNEFLNFWRSKSRAEVDFVVETGNGIFAFEVKAKELKRAELSRSARSFIEVYKPRIFHVINLGFKDEQRIGGTMCRWIGPEFFATPDAVLTNF
jgi:predicted AAA+ superfamily ATPase